MAAATLKTAAKPWTPSSFQHHDWRGKALGELTAEPSSSRLFRSTHALFSRARFPISPASSLETSSVQCRRSDSVVRTVARVVDEMSR